MIMDCRQGLKGTRANQRERERERVRDRQVNTHITHTRSHTQGERERERERGGFTESGHMIRLHQGVSSLPTAPKTLDEREVDHTK